MMRGKGPWVAAAALAACAACGGPERTVVDQYFNAVQHKDNQTLASFAAVSFDKPVQDWEIVAAHEVETAEMAMPGLVARLQELEKAVADNRKAAQNYSFDNLRAVDQVRELRRGGKAVPASLSSVAQEWDQYNDRDRELKKQLAEARGALEREKRNMRLSMGEMDDLEGVDGSVQTKKVELNLTIDGASHPYVMTLRKYDIKREGPTPTTRWVVQDIEPKQG